MRPRPARTLPPKRGPHPRSMDPIDAAVRDLTRRRWASEPELDLGGRLEREQRRVLVMALALGAALVVIGYLLRGWLP